MLNAVSWRLKIAAKFVLSRLPARYAFWSRLGIFRHGLMDRPEYAFDVVNLHMDRLGGCQPKAGFTCLELGPGDSLASALVARALGASTTYLVDAGSFARGDISFYRHVAALLEERSCPLPANVRWDDVDSLLRSCDAHYLTKGLESLRHIPDASIDRVWSHAVLEHIPLEEFAQTMREMRRVLRDGGACSHRVDLRDHINGGLNSLRFPQHRWESKWMRSSGIYTNRIRFREMITIFKESGFDVRVVKEERWSHLPIRADQLSEPFRSMPHEDLMVSGFDVVLRPA